MHLDEISLTNRPKDRAGLRSGTKYPPTPRGVLHCVTVADAVILVATVGAMVAVNRDWLFSWKNWVDTWMYLGYFLHYDSPYFLANDKKIARLPWILLGFFTNKLTSPIVASYILHAGLLIAGAFAFYRLSEKLFGRQGAILATLTYLTSQSMHGVGGWDYNNTLTPVLYFLSFLSFDSALVSGRRPFIAFIKFGVLFALTIHTNLLVLLLGPALLIHLIVRMRSAQLKLRQLRWILKSVAGFVVGSASITMCFGLVNLAFGRQFFFFNALVNRSAVLLGSPALESAWWRPWTDLWWVDDHSVHTALAEAVMALILIFSIATLIKRLVGGMRMKPIFIAIHLEYVVSVAFAAVFQTLGHPILQPDYMAFPLSFPMFLSLAALISQSLAPDPEKSPELESQPIVLTFLVIFAAIAFVAQVSGRLTTDYDFFAWAPRWSNKIPFFLTIIAIVGAAVLSRLRLYPPRGRIVVEIGCFAWLAVILGQANASWPDNPNRWKAYQFSSTCAERRSILSAIIDADHVLFPLARPGRHVITWYRSEEEVGPSLSCELTALQLGRPLYAMGYTKKLHYWEVEAAADMPESVIDNLTPGQDVVAVISSDTLYVSQLLARLRLHDPRWRETGNYTVGEYDIKFGLHLISAEISESARQILRLEAVPQHGATAQALPFGGFKIMLPNNPWTYAASLFPAGGLDETAGTLFVKVRVVSGSASIGILKRDGSDFLAREVLEAGPNEVEIGLDLSDGHAAGPLLIESAGASGGGEVIVSSLAFAAKPEASAPAPQRLAYTATAENGGTIAQSASGETEIQLPHGKWAYAARLALKLPDDAVPGNLIVGIRLVSGAGAIGVLNSSGTDFIARHVLRVTPDGQTVYLKIPDWRNAGPVVVESAEDRDGGTVIISSVAFAPFSAPSQLDTLSHGQ